MKNIICLLVVALLLSVVPVFAADPIREGWWEVSTTTVMPGMPMQLPPSVIKHCYSKEDVKDQAKVVAGGNKDCKMTSYKVSGNKVTWSMVCTGQSAGTFSGETVFSPNSYVSTMKMKSQGQNISMKMNAKRLGDCPKR